MARRITIKIPQGASTAAALRLVSRTLSATMTQVKGKHDILAYGSLKYYPIRLVAISGRTIIYEEAGNNGED